MITFLPSLDFEESAKVLDNRRLTNQLGEARFLLDLLINRFPSKWRSHPVLPMWRGHEWYLVEYAFHINQEMLTRGYKPSQNWERVCQLNTHLEHHGRKPRWIIDGRVPVTHQHALYHKRPDLYPLDWRLDKEWSDAICCEKKRRHKDGSTTGPCQYFWPSHDYE